MAEQDQVLRSVLQIFMWGYWLFETRKNPNRTAPRVGETMWEKQSLTLMLKSPHISRLCKSHGWRCLCVLKIDKVLGVSTGWAIEDTNNELNSHVFLFYLLFLLKFLTLAIGYGTDCTHFNQSSVSFIQKIKINIVWYRPPVNFYLASFPSGKTLGTRRVHVECWPQILEGDLCGLVEVQKWGQLSTGTL